MAVNQTTQSAAVLLPISVDYRGQRIDMAVSAQAALVEILPGMISSLGRLNRDSASQGFRVFTSSGEELDQSKTLLEQGVSAGTVLSLEAAGSAATDVRYDDLVEAIGNSVDHTRAPWTKRDSIVLSAYSAVGLFSVAGLLLALLGSNSILVSIAELVGAGLVLLAAAVVARIPQGPGATALALTVPLLTGAAGFVLPSGPAYGLPMLAAGIGVLIGSFSVFVLPKSERSWAGGTVLIGASLVLFGALVGLTSVSAPAAAALVLAIVTLITLLTPWIGLTQMPSRIDALTLGATNQVDPRSVERQVREAGILVLSLRIAAGIITVGCAIVVSVTPAGAALAVSAGLAQLLGTRSLYGRSEVLTGALSGMFTLLASGIVVTISLPNLLPWVVGITAAIGILVLANNVVSVRLRPWLSRMADWLHIIALMAILPLAAAVWGLF